MTTLKGNIDSKIIDNKLREIMENGFCRGHNCTPESHFDDVVSQLKQLINEFADEVIPRKRGVEPYQPNYPGEKEDQAFNKAIDIMRERKEKLLK